MSNQPAAKGPSYSAMNGSVHADHPGMDITFCGDALENENGDDPSLRVVAQRVTCERCVAIIEYAATIPTRFYRKRNSRRRNHL